MNDSARLREHAFSIWKAGVDAVRSEKLVHRVIQRAGEELTVCGHVFRVPELGRIAVVGAGKAGAGMARAVEESLGEQLVAERVVGWVNVPADCVRPLQKIHLHAGRPAGVNEPTVEGVRGAEQILKIVSELSPPDLCLVLISGGGSALLPAPIADISLEDKQAVTRCLMHGGATIQELNTVRKRLSRIKGGGLARACRAGQLIALIISDIVGDPLDMIASGPTYADPTTDAEALALLRKFAAGSSEATAPALEYLQRAAARPSLPVPFPSTVANHIVGNNALAVAAAAAEAKRRGFQVRELGSDNCGEANQEGRALAHMCRALREDATAERPICLLSGGEPVVQLAATDRPRKGGRNQQLVLAGLDALEEDGMRRIVLLSGGTDGEDGPTDAAGAVADAESLAAMRQQGLQPKTYLEINDSYSFFEAVGGLLKTGPTHTNVMDLRVALVGS